MMRMSVALAVSALSCPAVFAADLPELPSGFVPELMEEFIEIKPDGMHSYARFRFMVPALGEGERPEYDVIADDFMQLCAEYAAPRLEGSDVAVDRIVISYSDRAVEFGETNPEAVQFFEQFAFEGGRCIWEQY